MNLLKKNGDTLNKSRLLQHFKEFTLQYFQEQIVEEEFLSDLYTIVDKFRNKAAHIYSIDIDLAKSCKEVLRKNINIFLGSLK